MTKFKAGDMVKLKPFPAGAANVLGLTEYTWQMCRAATVGSVASKSTGEHVRCNFGTYTYTFPTKYVEKVFPEKKKEDSVTVVKKKAAKKKAKKKKRARKPIATSGFKVRAVISGSVASKIGIEPGDTITWVGGYRVYPSKKRFSQLMKWAKTKPYRIKIEWVKPDGGYRSAKIFGTGKLGVTRDEKKAAAYNAKLLAVSKAKPSKKAIVVSDTKPSKKVLAFKKKMTKKKVAKKVIKVDEPEENEFMKRAAIEMKGVEALMADMKGRDALLEARELKRKLLSELRNGTHRNAAKVDKYLEKVRKDSATEDIDLKGKRKLSKLGKIVFGVAGTIAVAAAASGAVWSLTALLG